ncbi:MAG: DUF3047 domain-containing protein [Nitrospirae bacterium]|nr:DUF3047 domain-containing protein [Nitrospirota bacterium]
MKFFRFLFSLFIIFLLFPFYIHASIVADIIPEGKSSIPKGWEIKEWRGKGNIKDNILIENDGDNYIIHLKSNKNSFTLHRELRFNIKEFPILHWKWKVNTLPYGGDVRDKKMDDQAAQLYVVFPKFPAMVNSRVIGYIWESSAPLGTIATSKKYSHTRYIVLRSGKEKLGEWIIEKRNVYADYKLLFNEEPPPVGKISIMIDSDDTKSSAESFFGEMRFEKEPVMIAELPKPIEKKMEDNIPTKAHVSESPIEETKEIEGDKNPLQIEVTAIPEEGENNLKDKKTKTKPVERMSRQPKPAIKVLDIKAVNSSLSLLLYIAISAVAVISIIGLIVLKRAGQYRKKKG